LQSLPCIARGVLKQEKPTAQIVYFQFARKNNAKPQIAKKLCKFESMNPNLTNSYSKATQEASSFIVKENVLLDEFQSTENHFTATKSEAVALGSYFGLINTKFELSKNDSLSISNNVLSQAADVRSGVDYICSQVADNLSEGNYILSGVTDVRSGLDYILSGVNYIRSGVNDVHAGVNDDLSGLNDDEEFLSYGYATSNKH